MQPNINNIKSSKEIIIKSIHLLEKYILQENYRGYDPYDALNAPAFNLPLLKNRYVRLVAQRVLRNTPVNFRKLLNISKGYNPVTLGLVLQAFSYLSRLFSEKQNFYTDTNEFLLSELKNISSSGYSGICWGYDFDWESRYSTFPAFTPTSVATGFITNALFENYRLSDNQKYFDFCESASDFIINDLNKTFDVHGNFCYSYSPLDKQVVFNATMKAARLLAQVYSVTGNESLLQEAKRTINYVMNFQREDGAWIYSHGDARNWVDNYHTAYILDCLKDFCHYSNDSTFANNLELGYQYYIDNFFTAKYEPKFYDKNMYPIDSTSGAQSILTLSKFGDLEKAVNVAVWVIRNMQSPHGFFYFRKYKFYTNKISYMRWSNSQMLLALSYLLFKISEVK